MEQGEVTVQRWEGDALPSEAKLRRILADEGLSAYRWSNGPGDRHGAHTHSYHKVIYVVSGSITFGLPERREEVALGTGDRMELPPGITHDAVVGPQGVVCLEAHRLSR